jgi:hypothetical protein
VLAGPVHGNIVGSQDQQLVVEDDEGVRHLVDPADATIIPEGARAVMKSKGEVLQDPAARLDGYLQWAAEQS